MWKIVILGAALCGMGNETVADLPKDASPADRWMSFRGSLEMTGVSPLERQNRRLIRVDSSHHTRRDLPSQHHGTLLLLGTSHRKRTMEISISG
jgi:hypothetical protein